MTSLFLPTIPTARVLDDLDPATTQSRDEPDANFEIVSIDAGEKCAAENYVSCTALVHAAEAPLVRAQMRNLTTPSFSCVRVSHAGNSGLGAFVASTVERGQLLMRERPILVYPQLLPYRAAGRHYAELEDALAHMSTRSRNAFLSLANCHPPELSVAKGIVDTNSLHLGNLPGGTHQYGAVCRDISRINHSCSPNAVYRFHPSTFTFEVRALSPIRPGSQVFISYIDPALPRDKRQEALSAYGFTCACTACSLTGIALTQSETRRALIARSDSDRESRDAALERWARTLSMPEDFISRVDKMHMDIFEKEQLYYEPVWEAFAVRLCKACCAVEDGDGTRKWARLAAALNMAYTGGDRGWDAVAAAPERTSWWGVRRHGEGRTGMLP